ncbi:hypothetical protein C8Q79DRAFT_979227 [Trametes meyenii]|nr:hypothetical protein C8Q79DRAFT_979227 [Trametes meyenii]
MEDRILPTLYADVLLSIMEVSPTHVAATLMRTCRTLYHEGPKWILAEGHFIRDSPGETDRFLRSFCLFLLAEHGSRFQYLRQIYFGVSWISNQDVAEMLVQCVRQMTHLEVLVFVVDLDALLDAHPGLVDAFCELSAVKHLQVSTRGKKCFPFLKKTRAQLVSAELRIWQDEDDDALDPTPDLNPISLLFNSRETLQSLVCENWDRHHFPSGSVQYPAMKRLVITCEEIPRTAALVLAYPNLSHLTVMWDDLDLPSDTTLFLNALNAKRLTNVHSQANFLRGWKKLDEVTGPIEALFALGLDCRVDKLIPQHGVRREADLIMLQLLIESVRPTYLRLDTLAEYFDERPFDIPDTFSKPEAAELRSIDINLSFKDDAPPDAPIEEYMAFLLHAVRNLPLENLSIEIDGEQFTERDEEDPSIVGPTGSAGLYLHDFNFLGLAQGFLDVMPTLRKIKMELTGVWNPGGNTVRITRTDTEGERTVTVEAREGIRSVP